MRLLDTETGQFVERDPKRTRYAILSHTWDTKGEQTYEELKKIQRRHKLGSHVPKASRPLIGKPKTCLQRCSKVESDTHHYMRPHCSNYPPSCHPPRPQTSH